MITVCRCKVDPTGREPCSCERFVASAIEKDSFPRFGPILGSLVCGALLDILREQQVGNEIGVRSARIDLLQILSNDQNVKRRIELAERKLEIDEHGAALRAQPKTFQEQIGEPLPVVLPRLVTNGEPSAGSAG